MGWVALVAGREGREVNTQGCWKGNGRSGRMTNVGCKFFLDRGKGN